MIYQPNILTIGSGGFGLVASHRRNIKNGAQYNHLFPAPAGTDPLLSKSASVHDTLDFMADIVQKTTVDTRAISNILKGNTLAETCSRIWNFCYNHIQYKKDSDGEEELRRPSRAWKDRISGIDCDCFAIFCSSILTNLKITHSLRICELQNKGYFQHVYVVVPSDQSATKISGKYFTIDPVLDKFNLEAPGITKTNDKIMIPVRYLNGIDETSVPTLYGNEFSGLGCACNSGNQVVDQFNKSCANHLRNVKRVCKEQPQKMGSIYNIGVLNSAIDHVLQYENDPEAFGNALASVAHLDDEMLIEGLEGVEEDLFGLDYALGKAKAGKKPGFLTKVAAGVKTVAKKAADKVEKSKVAEVAKAAGKNIVKFSPVTVAARAGFLLAMEINMFGIADQLKWGYATPEQLKKYGVSSSDAAKAKAALAKVEDMFVNTLKGQKDSLKKQILSGKQKIEGFSGVLGEPVTAAATTTAAMTFIVKAKDWIKGLNIVPTVKKIANDNPDLATKAKGKLLDKIFSKKKKTEIKNGKVQETQEPDGGEGGGEPMPLVPKTFSPIVLPQPQAEPMQPMLQNEALPTFAQDETQTDPTLLPPTEKKNGTNMLLIAGVGIALAALAFGSGSKPKKGLSGIEDQPGLLGTNSKKRKSKTKKTTKSKKSYTIKIK